MEVEFSRTIAFALVQRDIEGVKCSDNGRYKIKVLSLISGWQREENILGTDCAFLYLQSLTTKESVWNFISESNSLSEDTD